MQAAEAELQETVAGAERVRQEYAQLISWAGMYDNCTFEARNMIVAQFVKVVHVKRDYEIDIEFHVSFAEFQVIYLEPRDEDDKKPGANALLALTEKWGKQHEPLAPVMVDPKGLEPSTSRMRTERSPS